MSLISFGLKRVRDSLSFSSYPLLPKQRMRLATKKAELEEYIHDLEERIDGEEEKTMKIVAEKKKMEGSLAELESTWVHWQYFRVCYLKLTLASSRQQTTLSYSILGLLFCNLRYFCIYAGYGTYSLLMWLDRLQLTSYTLHPFPYNKTAIKLLIWIIKPLYKDKHEILLILLILLILAVLSKHTNNCSDFPSSNTRFLNHKQITHNHVITWHGNR